jgi:hypothetical protein
MQRWFFGSAGLRSRFRRVAEKLPAVLTARKHPYVETVRTFLPVRSGISEKVQLPCDEAR